MFAICTLPSLYVGAHIEGTKVQTLHLKAMACAVLSGEGGGEEEHYKGAGLSHAGCHIHVSQRSLNST